MEDYGKYSKEKIEEMWKSKTVEERAAEIWTLTAKKEVPPFSSLDKSIQQEFIDTVKEEERENGIIPIMSLIYNKYGNKNNIKKER